MPRPSDLASPYTHKRRPRLHGDCYRGRVHAFLTICVRERDTNLLAGVLPAQLVFHLAETAGRTGHVLHAWVLMPDHLHVLIEGTTDGADIADWVRRFKQRSAMSLHRLAGVRRPWQASFYDRMLRKADAIEDVCKYIFENPVRKELSAAWWEWPWAGGRVYELLRRDLREGNLT